MGGYVKATKSLPVPVDDGACDHLLGASIPGIVLTSTSGEETKVDEIGGMLVLYCYPMTGQPGVPLPEGWAQIPGAMGCTLEACAFRDRYSDLQRLYYQVCGLSTQSSSEQRESKSRLRLPFELLSDSGLQFADALGLPTFEAQGKRLIKRLTIIVVDGIIEKVFYPVFPPDSHADEVIEWMANSMT